MHYTYLNIPNSLFCQIAAYILTVFHLSSRVLPKWNRCMANHSWDFTLCVESKLHLIRPMTKLCFSSIFSISLAEFFSSNNLKSKTLTQKWQSIMAAHVKGIRDHPIAYRPLCRLLRPPTTVRNHPHRRIPCLLPQMGAGVGSLY